MLEAETQEAEAEDESSALQLDLISVMGLGFITGRYSCYKNSSYFGGLSLSKGAGAPALNWN